MQGRDRYMALGALSRCVYIVPDVTCETSCSSLSSSIADEGDSDLGLSDDEFGGGDYDADEDEALA